MCSLRPLEAVARAVWQGEKRCAFFFKKSCARPRTRSNKELHRRLQRKDVKASRLRWGLLLALLLLLLVAGALWERRQLLLGLELLRSWLGEPLAAPSCAAQEP